jgi:hypothetical protein
MKTLLQWRKSQPAIHNGKLTHFIPENNIYVYFRESDSQRVMVILNANDQEKTLPLAPFTECLRGAGRGVDIVSRTEVSLRDQVNVPAYNAMIIEVGKQ